VSNHVAQIGEIKAKLELANLAFARKEKLLAKGMTARAEFDAARAAKLELEASLEAAKAVRPSASSPSRGCLSQPSSALPSRPPTLLYSAA